jgi:hypothetical protein
VTNPSASGLPIATQSPWITLVTERALSSLFNFCGAYARISSLGLACRRGSKRHRDTLVLADGTLGVETAAVAFSMVGLRRRSKACPAMSGRVGCWRHPVVSCTGARAGYIPAELSLEGSTGAVYGAINCGDVQVAGLRRALAACRCRPGRTAVRLAANVRNWLRPDAATSSERLFCHYCAQGRGRRN